MVKGTNDFIGSKLKKSNQINDEKAMVTMDDKDLLDQLMDNLDKLDNETEGINIENYLKPEGNDLSKGKQKKRETEKNKGLAQEPQEKKMCIRDRYRCGWNYDSRSQYRVQCAGFKKYYLCRSFPNR